MIEEDLEVAGHVCPGVLVLAAILVGGVGGPDMLMLRCRQQNLLNISPTKVHQRCWCCTWSIVWVV